MLITDAACPPLMITLLTPLRQLPFRFADYYFDADYFAVSLSL